MAFWVPRMPWRRHNRLARRLLLESLEARALLTSLNAGPPANVSHTAQNQAQPTIALDPTNPQSLAVFANEVDGPGIQRSLSFDGGKTWTSSVLGDGTGTLPRASGDTSAVFDSFGNLFLAYRNTVNTSVTIALSTDEGQTFKVLTTINNVAGAPQLAAGPGGTSAPGSVWMEYHDGNTRMAAVGAPVEGFGQVGTFHAPEEVTGSDGGDYGKPTIGPKGQLLMSYEKPVNTIGPGEIFVALDPDGLGSAAFNSPVDVTAVNIGGSAVVPAQPVRKIDTEAGLAYDLSNGPHAGRVYLVKTDALNPGDVGTGIFLHYSDDNGTTWQPDVFVDDGGISPTTMLPRVAVDPVTGVVAISWLDTRNDTGSGPGDTDGKTNTDTEMYATVSDDGGQTFLQNIKVASGPSNAIRADGGTDDKQLDYGGFTGLAFFNNVFYPAWADNSASLSGNPDAPNFDIATAAITVVGPQGLTNLIVSPGSVSGREGQSIISATLATFSDPGGADPLSAYSATVDWGDGSPLAAALIQATGSGSFKVLGSHLYAEEGSYTVRVSVSDAADRASGKTSTTIGVSDAPLVARAGDPLTASEGQALTNVVVAQFNDADSAGTPSLYTASIRWGDGSVSAGTIVADPNGGFHVEGSHTYKEGAPGLLILTTIADRGGSSAQASTPVSVADLPITLTGTTLQQPENTTGSFIVATLTDANPSAQASEYRGTIDWGDNTQSAASFRSNGSGGFNVIGAHAYEEGTFTLHISVQDAGGSSATADSSVTVTDLPLTAKGTTVSAVIGQSFTATIGSFTDANAAAPASDFRATIDWGDQTTTLGNVIAQGNGQFLVQGNKTYAATGQFSVHIEIDDIGGSTTQATTSATVADAPMIVLGTYLTFYEGTTYNGPLARFLDADPRLTSRDFQATVSWGDGTSSVGVITPSPFGGFQVVAEHSAFDENAPSVVVTIHKIGGPSASVSDPTAIVDAPLAGAGRVAIASPGVVANNLNLGTLTDQNPVARATDFAVVIGWGDGQFSTGIAVSLGGGRFNILGTHLYAAAGNSTVGVVVLDVGGSRTFFSTAVSVSAHATASFTGGLNPLSDSGVSATDHVTNINRPSFLGTAASGSLVQLFAQGTGQSTVTPIGQGFASTSGAWSITASKPLADGVYWIIGVATDTAGVSTGPVALLPTASQAPLVIDTVGPRVTSFGLDPTASFVTIALQDDRGGLDLASLSSSANYAVSRQSPNPTTLKITKIAASASAATQPIAVALSMSNPRPPRGATYALHIHAGGVRDAAGNALDGEFSGRLPSGNGLPGGDFNATLTSARGSGLAVQAVVPAGPLSGRGLMTAIDWPWQRKRPRAR